MQRTRILQQILADPAKKRRLMIACIVATQAREGIETTEEQAAQAYDKVLRLSKDSLATRG